MGNASIRRQRGAISFCLLVSVLVQEFAECFVGPAPSVLVIAEFQSCTQTRARDWLQSCFVGVVVHHCSSRRVPHRTGTHHASSSVCTRTIQFEPRSEFHSDERSGSSPEGGGLATAETVGELGLSTVAKRRGADQWRERGAVQTKLITVSWACEPQQVISCSCAAKHCMQAAHSSIGGDQSYLPC